VLVLFKITIPEEERDPQLEHKLREEADEILGWAVQGCLDYQRIGLATPTVVRAETEQYRAAEEAFKMWLGECTELAAAEYGEKASVLLRSYNAWANDNRAEKLSHVSLAERLATAGHPKKERNTGNFYLGLRLLEGDSDQMRMPVVVEGGGLTPIRNESPRAREGHEVANASTPSTLHPPDLADLGTGDAS
jgi:putative DNA primase/helicase